MQTQIPKIANDLYYIGVQDPKMRTFDIIMHTANGTTYNAYLLKTKKGVVIFDTVKAEFSSTFLKNIQALCSFDEITHIILHHLEPDHSGALPALHKLAKNAKILISPLALPMLKAITKADELPFETVWTNKSLDLGDKTLHFLSTPNLHWPETMSSYLQEDQILFSGDVFGSHYCDERLFNDKVGDFSYAFKYYFDHIMRPFKSDIQKAINLYEKFQIKKILPLHGPLLCKDPNQYINMYKKWSMPAKPLHGKDVVSIFYLSSYGNTLAMAKAICQGLLSNESIVSNMYDLSALDPLAMLSLMDESKGIIIGSPTINSDAPKPVWDLLSSMMFLEKRGRFGGCFGSYGWSGEGLEMVQNRLKTLKFRVPLEPLKARLIPNQDELKACEDFGKSFGQIVGGKMVEITL
jgi:flavorubredoxin